MQYVCERARCGFVCVCARVAPNSSGILHIAPQPERFALTPQTQRPTLCAGGIYAAAAASTVAECHRNMQPVLHGIRACSINNAARPGVHCRIIEKFLNENPKLHGERVQKVKISAGRMVLGITFGLSI